MGALCDTMNNHIKALFDLKGAIHIWQIEGKIIRVEH